MRKIKSFEFCNDLSKGKNGRKTFRVILHEIYPDDCEDTVNKVGTKYNKNGITWIRKYCEPQLDSIVGMSLRCEFLDENRTEINGHGYTGDDENDPTFEDATMIGTFTRGYIDEIETDNGVITACIGEGEIDAQCYHNFCKKLEKDVAMGNFPMGSVEIRRKEENNGIGYKYGWVAEGRIPTDFVYSGYALIGVPPADDTAQLIELNEQKEEKQSMDENAIKSIVSQTVAELTNHAAEMNRVKEQYEGRIAELNQTIETITAEKNEIIASSEKIQKALDDLTEETNEKYKEIEALYAEKRVLETALGEAKAKERIGELNEALAEFTDEEKAFAQAEIDAFTADPVNSEINAVTDKILVGIGKRAKAEAAIVSEQNQEEEIDIEDIFSVVETNTALEVEDDGINEFFNM